MSKRGLKWNDRTLLFPTVSEVKQEATQKACQISDHWTRLNRILRRYEAVLHKRWNKKSSEQKRKVLLTAWPQMPQLHRPDFQAPRRRAQEQRGISSRLRNVFMLPYINVEDLGKAQTLLLLLHSRGHHLPELFVHVDIRSMHLGLTGEIIPYCLTPCHVIILAGQRMLKTYGKVLSLEELQRDETPGLRRTIYVAPGVALLVLEAHEKLLQFLVDCTKLILHDLPLDDPGTPNQPSPPSLAPSDAGNEWQSMFTAALESSYRVPHRQLDLLRLDSLLHAQRAEAIDRVWSLREDPSYFAEMALDLSEHCGQQVPSASGEPVSHSADWN